MDNIIDTIFCDDLSTDMMDDVHIGIVGGKVSAMSGLSLDASYLLSLWALNLGECCCIGRFL